MYYTTKSTFNDALVVAEQKSNATNATNNSYAIPTSGVKKKTTMEQQSGQHLSIQFLRTAPIKEKVAKAANVSLVIITSILMAVLGLEYLSLPHTILSGITAIVLSSFLSDCPYQLRTAVFVPIIITTVLLIISLFFKNSGAYHLWVFFTLLTAYLVTYLLLNNVISWRRRAVLVGYADDITKAMQNNSLRQETVGFLTADGAAVLGTPVPTIGALDNCRHLFVEKEIDRVVVVSESFASRVLEKTESLDSEIEQAFNHEHPRYLRRVTQTIDDRIAKRAFDITASGVALLLLLPVFAVIALAIKFNSPGPVFFRQPRWGRNGETFHIYKFRSMYNNRCDDGQKNVAQAQQNDSRITKVGGFLRKTSLDELPQLINVLKGDMSLIGPRPHAVAHNFQYLLQIDGYAARHRVRPGLSGLAQVEGYRGETPTLDLMQKRIDYDNEYIEKWSLWLDIKIILRTIKLVLKRTNAY